jgi:predicted RNA-binding Zn ribbon-like protein
MEPLFLAGNLALDFTNTRVRLDGELVDLLQRDQDVVAWLLSVGLPGSRLAVLEPARALREAIRSLVEKRKAGHRGDPSVLNRFLEHAKSHPRLVWKKEHAPTVESVPELDTPEAALAPIAGAAADLLAMNDFSLVKKCEDEACVLWFHDQTKSHHRRWCSVALCGNRNKVAAYRRRLRGD